MANGVPRGVPGGADAIARAGEPRILSGGMGSLALRLLGGFECKTSLGHPVPIRSQKAQALLAYLACHPGQSHPRDKLATLLWPEIDDHQARANLRKALFVLRPALAVAPSSLRIEEGAVALDTGALDIDVVAFERLVRQGTPQALQQAAESTDDPEERSALRRAAAAVLAIGRDVMTDVMGAVLAKTITG